MIIFVTEMKFFLFSILSGLLLALSWPNIGGLSYLIFVAFVPLFYFLSEEIMQNNYSRLKLFFVISFDIK